ncbi:MAG: hypothetical protein GXO31_03990 [Epsilonproteobacteria bacterium]|nr:hypothetical protein [Campylobacterota bacterium]
MTKNSVYLLLLAAVLFVAVSYVLDFRAKKYYRVHAPEVDRLEVEAKELNELKRMFDRSKTKSFINSLKRLRNPSKDYKRGGVRVLEFSALDKNSLRLIIKKILNSGIKLKTFRVMREKERASLYLEIYI